MEGLSLFSNGVSQLTGAFLGKWQNGVDIVAELLTVPAGLIMRCQGNEIEVLVASTPRQNSATVFARTVSGNIIPN